MTKEKETTVNSVPVATRKILDDRHEHPFAARLLFLAAIPRIIARDDTQIKMCYDPVTLPSSSNKKRNESSQRDLLLKSCSTGDGVPFSFDLSD